MKRIDPKSFCSLVLYICLWGGILVSCNKGAVTTSPDATLFTSADTLFFDTIFVSSGSVTKSFKIFNNNDRKLRLSALSLGGGSASPFQLNINGIPEWQSGDVTINARDSMYVFVQVNVDPTMETTPFILQDSIEIVFNGNKRYVQLEAYGQNAVFLKNAVIKGNQDWSGNLPYVITGSLRVDTNATLNIAAGTRIFLHANAPVLVDGTLIAQGEKAARIVFSGNRLDKFYKDFPAAWPGIHFRGSSKENVLEYTNLINGYQGIVVQGPSTDSRPKVILSKCIIDNIYDAGITGSNTHMEVDNTLVSNCGSNIVLKNGGEYNFTSCTVVSYGNVYFAHKNPVLQVSNFWEEDGMHYSAPLKATFINSIFWGGNGPVENEILLQRGETNLFDITFDHVLYKSSDEVEAVFISALKNNYPHFDSINFTKNIYDFRFRNHPAAPAVNAGKTTPFVYDLDGNERDHQPDIGCFER